MYEQLRFTEHLVMAGFIYAYGISVADITGNGVLGLITAAKNVGLHWHENDGHPERGSWRKHIICESFPNAFEAIAADLDGDGQMEVIALAWEANGRIVLFKHQDDLRGPWTMQMLKEDWRRANSVIVADLNGDGWLGIVASAEIGSEEVRWWRNEASGSK